MGGNSIHILGGICLVTTFIICWVELKGGLGPRDQHFSPAWYFNVTRSTQLFRQQSVMEKLWIVLRMVGEQIFGKLRTSTYCLFGSSSVRYKQSEVTSQWIENETAPPCGRCLAWSNSGISCGNVEKSYAKVRSQTVFNSTRTVCNYA